MLKVKKKYCNGCKKLTVIWKSVGAAKYCKNCWSRHTDSKVRQTSPRAKPLPRTSKRQKLDSAYSILRVKYLKDHTMCEAHLSGCATYSSEIHHKKGRGEYFLDSSTWLAVCRPCHQTIELNPKEAKELGFSVERLKKEDNE